jgi:hypothetical protein
MQREEMELLADRIRRSLCRWRHRRESPSPCGECDQHNRSRRIGASMSWSKFQLLSMNRKLLKAQRPDAETPGRHLEPIALGRSVGLVPTNASTCAPVCTPAGGGVIACACRRGAIVCTPMHSTIDASNAHRCQGTPNSSVRSIK